MVLPPYVGTIPLINAIRPSLTRILGASSTQPLDLISLLGVLGFLLLVVGSLICLVSFSLRFRQRQARLGILTCLIGLLLVTVSLFDYRGDVLAKILAPTQIGVWPSLEFYGIGYIISWIAVLMGALSASRPPSRTPGRSQTTQTVVARKIPPPHLLPTGYAALDNMLLGGISSGSSILLTGPPCDEKNMILKRFMETTLANGRGCVYISTSIDHIRDLLSKHGSTMQVILCHPQAETIAASFAEVLKLRNVDNLTEINLAFTQAAAKLSSGNSSALCLEILDDVLLARHGETRRWLMDILGRSKSNQMTCLATLNPAMHPGGESQAVLETFDGHIDLYEAELQVRPKLIRVRKFGGKKFLDNELVVDREKI